MEIVVNLVGVSPLLHHNPRMVDPEYELNREIKALTSKRKKTDEDLKAVEKLEWFGGLYDENGIIVQPTSKVRKAIINAGRVHKLGKAIERSLSFYNLTEPLGYQGPKDILQVFGDKRFHSRLSVGVGDKRIMRVRPQFMPWELRAKGLFVEDTGLNFDELVRIVELSGLIEGIGDNRVNGYGRFRGTVEVL